MLAKRIAISCLVFAITVIMCASCTDDQIYQSDAAMYKEQKRVNINQASLLAEQPTPQLSYSQERAQQIAKAEMFANPEKIGYIYLISYGNIMAFHTVRGKVSSLTTYLTPMDRLYQGEVMQGPDVDGTYGENARSIFFFTSDGFYVEWQGEYMYSDAPLKMTTPPKIVYTAPLEE